MDGKIPADRGGAALLHRLADRWRLRLLAPLLNRLLPNACALCGGDSDGALCPGCEAQFFGPAAAIPRCACCANPLRGATAADALDSAALGSGIVQDALLCGACLHQPPAFDRTLVAADYVLPVDQLVLQLKFGHRLALAPLCARLLRDAVLREAARRPDSAAVPALLCPVPLGPRRLAERGYNQALEIARPLARGLGIALAARLVHRVHETAAQSSVTPAERQANIAGAFAIPDAALVAGRHIGVVDDVMTSGRTLNELAATLKRHGAARVSNYVFARTPPH
ncbi:phosphoribosyltransferase family protein [Duganella sp. P38]|uniref:ComF family protein n=1 Tax=Duganella sp. P38 TaxID=3423949 RepID=UPI003D79F6E5